MRDWEGAVSFHPPASLGGRAFARPVPWALVMPLSQMSRLSFGEAKSANYPSLRMRVLLRQAEAEASMPTLKSGLGGSIPEP